MSRRRTVVGGEDIQRVKASGRINLARIAAAPSTAHNSYADGEAGLIYGRVVPSPRVSDIDLNLGQSISQGGVQANLILLIRELADMHLEDAHRGSTNDQENQHRDHEFEKSEAGIIAQVRSILLGGNMRNSDDAFPHGRTVLIWNVSGAVDDDPRAGSFCRVTRTVIVRMPGTGVPA